MAYARGTGTGSISTLIKRQRRRLCTKCTSEKDADGMKWCAPCRLASAIAHRMFYWNQKKAHLCVRCVDSAHRTREHGHYCHCADHNKYRNDWCRARYERLRAGSLCVRCGVTRSPDMAVCDACKDKIANRTRRLPPPPRKLQPIRKQPARKAA